jgi:hypothetical protein
MNRDAHEPRICIVSHRATAELNFRRDRTSARLLGDKITATPPIGLFAVPITSRTSPGRRHVGDA